MTARGRAKLAIVPAPAAAQPEDRPSHEHPIARAGTEPPPLAERFRALYEAEVSFVWRNLKRLGITWDIEDKVQEVFIVAFRRFGEFRDLGFGPRAWLFQIVLRVASESRRHRRRHPEDADGGVAISQKSVEPDQAAAMVRREALGRLDRALAKLSLDQRAVLVLHDIEEMSAPEVAKVLSIPTNTVYSRLRSARGELQGALQGVRTAERGAKVERTEKGE